MLLNAATTLFAYGTSAGDSMVPASDDTFASLTLSDPFPFFGDTYTNVFVSPRFCSSLKLSSRLHLNQK